jgi:hypothetical protein
MGNSVRVTVCGTLLILGGMLVLREGSIRIIQIVYLGLASYVIWSTYWAGLFLWHCLFRRLIVPVERSPYASYFVIQAMVFSLVTLSIIIGPFGVGAYWCLRCYRSNQD